MKIFISLFLLLSPLIGICQCDQYYIYESFSTVLPTQMGTWVSTSVGAGTTSSTARTGNNYLVFNALNDAMRLPLVTNPGVLSFWYRRSTTSTGTPKFVVQTSLDNATWTDRLSVTTFTTTYQQATIDIGALGLTNVYIRIIDKRASGSAERYIDDLSLTSTLPSENTLIPFLSNCNQTLNVAYTYTITDNIGPEGPVYGNYPNNINRTVVLSPSDPTKKLTVTFNNVDLETDYDYLYIYDGPNASSPLLATLTGIATPADVTATNATGQLTFLWTTDISNVGSWGGFEAYVMTITPLPVELIYFEGEPGAYTNKLKWGTASEFNSDFFEIHHSLDGYTWNVIGYVKAAGNSSQLLHYIFAASLDKNFSINYYRLKQVDFDGNYKIYGPIAVMNQISLEKKIVKYFNLAGQEIQDVSNFRGMYIILYDDGTAQKGIK